MIEISHAQARLLLRQAVDRRLPDDQWAILQAHLESCAECSDYQRRLKVAEREVRRALQLRWNPVNLRSSGLGQSVVKRRQRRDQIRQFMLRAAKYGGGALAVILLLIFYNAYQRLTAPLPTPTPWPTAPGGEVTATARAQAFRGVVAFSSTHEGSADVYLLNAGGGEDNELVNLTATGEFNETDPAWSPDGEWIAFLSDRGAPPDAPAKRDVYVMHVAGSRLTRLTNDPAVDFTGPLSWSYDGRWISARGMAPAARPGEAAGAGAGDAAGDDLRAAFLYVIPVMGEGEGVAGKTSGLNADDLRGGFAVPGTRGVSAAEFSPSTPFLAYSAGEQLNIYFPETARFILANPTDYAEGFHPGSFDWSPNGIWLSYAGQGPVDLVTGQPDPGSRSHMRVTLQYNPVTRDLPNGERTDLVVNDADTPQAYRAVAWSPVTTRRLLAYLQEAEEEPGCWTVRMAAAPLEEGESAGVESRELSELCVEGDAHTALDRTAWTADGRWLLLAGRMPGDEAASIYALRVPRDLISIEPILVERISDLAYPPGEDLPIPRLRPYLGERENLLSIMPNPVGTPEPEPRPSLAQPPALPDAPLLTTGPDPEDPGMDTLRVERMLGEAQPALDVVISTYRQITCPSLSPDGGRIAYLSDMDSRLGGVNQVYVMNKGEYAPQPVTRPVFATEGNPTPYPRYRCATWSPDGEALAAVVETRQQAYLALIPAHPGSTRLPNGTVYVPVERPSTLALPLWSPDGSRVYMLSTQEGNRPARLLVYYLDGILASAVDGIAPLVERDVAGSGGEDSTAENGAGDSGAGDGGAGNGGAEIGTYSVALFLSGWDEIHGWAFAPQGDRLALLLARYNRDGSTLTQLRVLDHATLGTLLNMELETYDPRGIGRPNPLAWTADGQITFINHTGLQRQVKAQLVRFDPLSMQLNTLAEFKHLTYDAAFSPDFAWAVVSGEAGLYLVDARNEPRAAPLLVDDTPVEEVDW